MRSVLSEQNWLSLADSHLCMIKIPGNKSNGMTMNQGLDWLHRSRSKTDVLMQSNEVHRSVSFNCLSVRRLLLLAYLFSLPMHFSFIVSYMYVSPWRTRHNSAILFFYIIFSYTRKTSPKHAHGCRWCYSRRRLFLRCSDCSCLTQWPLTEGSSLTQRSSNWP